MLSRQHLQCNTLWFFLWPPLTNSMASLQWFFTLTPFNYPVAPRWETLLQISGPHIYAACIFHNPFFITATLASFFAFGHSVVLLRPFPSLLVWFYFWFQHLFANFEWAIHWFTYVLNFNFIIPSSRFSTVFSHIIF